MGFAYTACVEAILFTRPFARCSEGVQIVVGTCGRVFDMINRGALGTTSIRTFVLDDADALLASVSNRNKVYDVFKFVPQKVHVRSSLPR